jgi:type II secretory pathway predicted ATPase ExeA
LEHLHHFELAEDPFRSDAGEKFDVELPSQRQALLRLDRAVRQGRGLVVLVGGVGAGKTRVARRLYEGLEEEQFEAAMMVVLRREVGAEWLLSRIARQLGVDPVEADREAVIRQIYERLAIVHEDGRRAVLIVDDAQGLANPDTLAEVCSLVKLEYEERRLVTIVLVGNRQLDAAIAADPHVSHHLDARVALAPLARDEAGDYVAARLVAAGGSGGIVMPGASAALHELAEGAPGRINALADNALFEAWLAGHPQVARADVERAHADLGWGARVTPPSHAPRRASPVEAELTHPDALDVARAVESDPELDAAFEPPAARRPRGAAEAHRTMGMDFEADPERTVAPARRAGFAEATRIELDEPGAPPKGDDVDDLFMELLDD